MSIYVRETYLEVREDERVVCFGESQVYETRYDTVKELFDACQKEYGRCVSRIYYGSPIGWAFRKTSHYEDTGEPFVQETLVELHEATPTRTVQYHYMSI